MLMGRMYSVTYYLPVRATLIILRTYAVARFEPDSACGSTVLSDPMFFDFALCERKNEKR
jgi:hypothetical protein